MAAFQRARVVLPAAFAEVVERMSYYHEVDSQNTQLHLLFRERVDFIVLDERIFDYYQRTLARNQPAETAFTQPVDKHCLFEPSRYRIEFNTRAGRDALNAGLTKLKQSDRLDQILQKYQNVN